MIWIVLACTSSAVDEQAPKEKQIQDFDNDGYLNDVDCDDIRESVYPNAPEICDGLDNNCDGLIDDDDPSVSADQVWYEDADGDGFGNELSPVRKCLVPAGYSAEAEDCDDNNANIHPNATEICDEVDNNCNALFDEDDPMILASELIAIIPDHDDDGYGDKYTIEYACNGLHAASNALDCDDTNPSIHPQAWDYCDGIDNDCNGYTDPHDEMILLLDDGTPQVIDVEQRILLTEGMELHNCYPSLILDEQLGIQTSLNMYNHRENATLVGTILIYVENNVEIHNLHINPTNSFVNTPCTSNNCYPGLMCTMDANVLFIDGSIQNGSSLEGGNVFVRACNLTIENSSIVNGLAERGGGIYVEYGSLTLLNTYITGNQSIEGAGIYLKQAELYGEMAQVSYNFADEGAGIYAQDSTGSISELLLQNNDATNGGGAALYNGDLLCTSCTINDNQADYGGGILVSGGSLHLLSTTLLSNTAFFGGHSFVHDTGTLIWENSLGRYAEGGAAWIEGEGYVECLHTDSSSYSGFFSNNLVGGGAINIANAGTFLGEGCDMGVQGQPEDNFDTDIALFHEGILFDTKEANNNANILCTENACNYQ